MGLPAVAIIGTGITGIVTLKNTLEEGFGATEIESRDTSGGVWKHTRNGKDLSVLKIIVSNKSRFKNPFTDFTYPKGSPPFPTAPQVQAYWSHMPMNLISYYKFVCKRRLYKPLATSAIQSGQFASNSGMDQRQPWTLKRSPCAEASGQSQEFQ